MKLKTFTLFCALTASLFTVRAEIPEADYSDGVFLLNEDWFGHRNSSVSFLRPDGEWEYRVFSQQNPGQEIGCTSQFATIFGGRMYIISKQEKDAGATVTGGRITVCDAKTMKCIGQLPVIASDADGKSVADGRAFVGISGDKGYVSTSNGIYPLNLNTLEVGDMIDGTGNASGSLYSDQCGMMLFNGENLVFAVHQTKGLLIIDTETDEIVSTIAPPADVVNGKVVQRGFGSIVRSKDGDMWLSVSADCVGRGATVDYFMRLDAGTLDTVRICLPTGYGTPSSWYAWTADAFCASSVENKLYWKKQGAGWFSNTVIVCYDIDRGECSDFFDAQTIGWNIYCGAGFRLHPATDDIYMSLYQDNMRQDYLFVRLSNRGELLSRHEMINNYWFPSMPVFPEAIEDVGDDEEDENLAVSNIEMAGLDLFIAGQELHITLATASVVEIYDMAGVRLMAIDCRQESNIISVAELPKGVYVVKTPTAVTKFIKN